ncbi:unnamed protein product [Symbiodinium microadriaticum]|nr:unnamed protein product [Symbiodinium microadriaticum]
MSAASKYEVPSQAYASLARISKPEVLQSFVDRRDDELAEILEGIRAFCGTALKSLAQEFDLIVSDSTLCVVDKDKVLNGLSLTIQRGQKVAVVGESGSGKSTVMALLERFYDPDSGAVLVNGQNMNSFKISALRRCIGYVGQEPVLFASSIRHNIMQGNPSASKEDFAKACADAQLGFVDNLPEKYPGYNTFVGSGGGQLSGGQKQRIAIARALLKKASFLFLDEATSALDNTSEKMIQATIDSISANTTEGLGIVSIAHRLSTVKNSDLIYVLSRGTLVEKGNHTSLMEKKGTYYALVAAQESSHKADEAEENTVPEVPHLGTYHELTRHDQTLQMVVKRSSTNSGESESERVTRRLKGVPNQPILEAVMEFWAMPRFGSHFLELRRLLFCLASMNLRKLTANCHSGNELKVRMHTTTPAGAKSDIRIVDIIDTEGIFHEIKTGSVRYTQATANQILKDAHIVKHNRACQGYVWEFFPGKTGETKVDPKVLQELDKHGIQYIIHGHKPALDSLDAAIKCPHCSKEDILKNVQDMAPKSSTDKVASAMSQATVLKVAGAVNLAVVLLSLGAAPVLREHVDLLEQTVPELSEECSRFKASLDKMEVELDATLAQPKDRFNRRQHHINAVVKTASRDFDDLRFRFNEIIRDRDARQRQEQAENCAIISGCTVLMGLVLTVAVVECHCGAGVALGLSSAAAGGTGAAGLESIHQCTRIIDKTLDELRLATSAEQDLNHKYMQLMEVLETGMLAALSESVWRVKDWTHAESYITKICRQDALARLSRIGGGSVLGAQGQKVLIGRYDGGADISLCTITDIEGHGGVYEAAVQCSTSFSVKREKEAEANREKEIAKNYKVPMGRLLSYNKPEWPFFIPAILGAMVDGSAMPVCTIALVGSMEGFFKPDKEEMRADLEQMALIFVIIGVSEAMTQRLRVAILTGMFRQEAVTGLPIGMLSKALELWAFRVATLCKSVQAKAAAMSSLVVGLVQLGRVQHRIAFVYCWEMSLVMLGSIPIMLLWLDLLPAKPCEPSCFHSEVLPSTPNPKP